MNRALAEKIHDHLKNKAKNILIFTHKRPDGDALGAATALYHLLTHQYDIEQVRIQSAETIPTNLAFLPYYFLVHNESIDIDMHNPDTIIVVDSGDLNHTKHKTVIENFAKKATVINIDHHVTNKKYGDLALVNTQATSTTEIVYEFCKINNLFVDAPLATSLLTGIITDTNNFANSATNISSLAYASELISAGGDLHTIQRNVFQNKTLPSLHLWGTLLTRLEKHPTLNIVYTYVSRREMDALGKCKDDGGFANFLNNLSEGSCGFLISELNEQSCKISIRTTRDDVNVAKIAQLFGGGGHQKAAGFTISKPVSTALTHLFSTLEKNIHLLPQK